MIGLVQAHIPSFALAWNPPAWSLSAEAFFYLVFPFVAPVILACRRRATLAAIGVGCQAITLALSVAYVTLDPDGLDLARGDLTLRLPFPERVTTAEHLRRIVVALAAKARAA